MPLTTQDWHNRFMIQAQWTKALRLYFFDLLKISGHEKILDIGCGTGALLPDLEMLTPAEVYGADICEDHLHQAQIGCQSCNLSCADVLHLPFPDQTFDIVLSHYFLMWISDPERALKDMVRISKPGAYIVAFAEPDYEGRLDYPLEFIKIKDEFSKQNKWDSEFVCFRSLSYCCMRRNGCSRRDIALLERYPNMNLEDIMEEIESVGFRFDIKLFKTLMHDDQLEKGYVLNFRKI